MKVLALVVVLAATSSLAEPAEQRGSVAAAGVPTTLQATAAAPVPDAGFFGLPLDKVAHGAVSAAGTPLFAGILLHAGVKPGAAVLLGAGGMLAIGLAKELVDVATTPRDRLRARLLDSAGDLAFDLGGCAAGAFAAAFLLDGVHPPAHRFSFRLQLRGRSLFVTGRF